MFTETVMCAKWQEKVYATCTMALNLRDQCQGDTGLASEHRPAAKACTCFRDLPVHSTGECEHVVRAHVAETCLSMLAWR